MKEAGIDPTKDCTLTTVNDIPSEMISVLNGQLDACFVFEGARYVFKDKFADNDIMDELRVLYYTEGDIPNDAIAVQKDMDSELKDKVKETFLNMAEDERGKDAMSLWGHKGYTDVSETAYDTIDEYTQKAVN